MGNIKPLWNQQLSVMLSYVLHMNFPCGVTEFYQYSEKERITESQITKLLNLIELLIMGSRYNLPAYV